MFGLMRSRSCADPESERLRRRLHYCGTCKTMGRLYGQRTRMLLNFDTVFAAELLTSLSGADEMPDWDASYQSLNCMRLPSSVDEMPRELRYAAAMNVALAEIKLDDKRIDSRHKRWDVAKLAFSSGFRRAADDLARMGFPVEALRRSVREQADVEARLTATADAVDETISLDRLAEAARPTADATAHAFEHGAVISNRIETRPALARLGFAFGSMIYVLDALKDFEADVRSGEFNAIRAACAGNAERLRPDVRRRVTRFLRDNASIVEEALVSLPIPPERAARFAERLAANLARAGVVRRLNVVSHVARPSGHACARVTRRQRVAASIALSRSLAAHHLRSCGPIPLRWAELPFVVGIAAFAGFVAPHLALAEPSIRQCVDASLNLATIGSAFAAMAVPPPLPPGPIDPTRPRGRAGATGAESDSGGSWCDGGCCDCCDCGDCGDASCCCFSCEGCSGCDACSCCESCGSCGDCCGSCGDCSCDC